jgi:hypothetical protein
VLVVDPIWLKLDGFYATAVRPGDVAVVPEPVTYALLLAGLGVLGAVARDRKQSSGTAPS